MFTLTRLFDKFTFSCGQSTNFPWQVFVARVHGILLKQSCIYLKSKPPFVCQSQKYFWNTAVYTQTNFPCPKAGMTSFATRLLRKEILSKIRKIVYHTHEQINIVLTKDKEGLLVKVNCSSVHGFKLIKLHVVAIW